MKVSTRINGRVTSINVRNTICSLHYIICSNDSDEDNSNDVYGHVLDTCHTIISTWKGKTGKGLSGYITDQMLEDLLDQEDLPLFHKTIEKLTE